MDQFRPDTGTTGSTLRPPATGVAQDQITGAQQYTFNPTTNFSGAPEFYMTFANTTTDTDFSNVNIIPKITNTTPSTLPTGMVISGTYTWPQFLQLVQRDKIFIKSMRWQSDVIANYGAQLQMGNMRYDGVDAPQIITLTKYRKSVGNGYSDIIEINDKPFAIKARFFMILTKLLKASQITVTFVVAGEEVPTMVPLS